MGRLFLFTNKQGPGQIREEQNEKRNTAEMRRSRRSRSINAPVAQDNSQDGILPTTERRPHHHHRDRTPHRINTGIQPAGESGRRGIHPIKFCKIVWTSASRASKLCGIFWPVVPAAITISYVRPDLHLWIFILNYIAMIPCANLIGFAGQELSLKLHKVFGVLIETTLGSIVEIVLFMVLLKNNEFEVIKAAILGSILATQLLCLGLCFAVGGARHDNQEFDEVVGEVGSDLLLTAGFGLIIPAAFHLAVTNSGDATSAEIETKVLMISRVTAILLMVSYAIYVFFQIRTHESIYDAIFEEDMRKDKDKHRDEARQKLTFTECVLALAISIALVTIIAICLVKQIHYIVEDRHISDLFLGLILVPLVEKFAEHLTAIDEAWDNQMNMALSHVLGATLQTSLFNGPLAVIVAWGLGKGLDLNFQLFNVAVLILAILVVGNFLRDQKSNYLEGSLCVIVYINIAVAAYYYPNPKKN